MQTLAGGAAARPFETHHNALDIPLFMRIAPELYLKRLLVGGFSKVFELNRNFRNEGISPRHNPEFTMLEAYEAYGSWETMAELVESLITTVAQNVLGTLLIEHKNAHETVRRRIDLRGDESKPPGKRWRRVRMADLVEERTGWRFDKTLAPESVIRSAVDEYKLRRLHSAARRASEWNPAVSQRLLAATTIQDFERDLEGLKQMVQEEYQKPAPGTDSPEWDGWCRSLMIIIDVDEALCEVDTGASHTGKFSKDFFYKITRMSPAEQLVEMYEKLIEPTLIDPTFVTHVPSVMIPLAKESPKYPGFADVYELAINGVEISPGYSELNDPDVQEKHFHHQVGDKEEQHKVDEDFLTALKYGMPPAGGMGMGVDRLVMMLTGAESIRDVILFPLMKPVE